MFIIKVRGSNRSIAYATEVAIFFGALAQLGERGLCKPEVRGSIPLCSTIMNTTIHLGGRFLLGNLHGSNPVRAQQSSGLLCKEGKARRREARYVESATENVQYFLASLKQERVRFAPALSFCVYVQWLQDLVIAERIVFWVSFHIFAQFRIHLARSAVRILRFCCHHLVAIFHLDLRIEAIAINRGLHRFFG